MTTVREPAVAGRFYPADPEELSAAVQEYLRAAETAAGEPTHASFPKAIIAPHAGYVYSAPIAASVYARLRSGRETVRRVIIIGPAHRVAVEGLALPQSTAFATPLGEVPVDAAAADSIAGLECVELMEAAHDFEHTVEVHLPFLQEVLEAFSIVPLVGGDATAAQMNEVLDTLWGGAETVIVISSDLSHFHDYDTAVQLGGKTSSAIEALDHEVIGREQACGRIPIQGLLMAASKREMRAHVIDVRNSGDTAGNRGEVVGYGAYAFY